MARRYCTVPSGAPVHANGGETAVCGWPLASVHVYCGGIGSPVVKADDVRTNVELSVDVDVDVDVDADAAPPPPPPPCCCCCCFAAGFPPPAAGVAVSSNMGVGRAVKTTTRPDKRRRADAKTRSAAKGINDARGAMVVVGLPLLAAVLPGEVEAEGHTIPCLCVE